VTEGLLLVFVWWFWIQIIGLVTWPLSHRFFRSFPDNGYILAKGLGLLLTGFVNWTLVSLRIMKFSVLSVITAIVVVAVASWFLKKQPLKDFLRFFAERKKIVFTTETLFLAAFIAFAIVRMGNPDIAQTEKMPDYAFLTGIVTSDYFPPRDPWFADGTINYFYYGHYLVGMLTKVARTAPEYGYNLGVALIFAFTLLNAAGVTYALIKKLWFGVLGGLFVAFIGNLDCAVQFFSHLGKFLSGETKIFPFTWFNWWMSSRVIVREGVDITINEFPFWSYILGDLHAHMNVVPISLIVLAVILEFFRSSGDGLDSIGHGNDKWFRLAVAAIALGAIPAANTWDTPTYYALMTAGLLLGRQFRKNGRILSIDDNESMSVAGIVVSPFTEFFSRICRSIRNGWKNQGWSELLQSWLGILGVVVLSFVVYLPFHANFHPAGTQGLRVVNPVQYTLAGDFLTIYGFFFYCMFPFAAALLWPRFKNLNARLKPLASISIAAVFFVLILAFDRFMIPFCLFFLVFVLAVPLRRHDPEIQEKFFALAMCLMVLLILLGCEFFYIKDAYGRTLERQNTIFKFYYQAWIFCGVASAYAVYWIRKKVASVFYYVWEPGFRILFVCTLMFPFIGSAVKTNHFRSFTNSSRHAKPTLDGMFYMNWQHKGDYEAIMWLRRHADPKQRVLEATGPAFSHYGRISAATGMATILGWGNHQNIWRDGTWKMVNERSGHVRQAYTSNHPDQIRSVLDQYGIEYVFYGRLERDQYPNSSPDNFAFLEKVMETRDTDNRMTYLFRYVPTN
jgi:YYY domain-containing protein